MPPRSFMLDPEALARRPELLQLIKKEILAEKLRRGEPLTLGSEDVVGVSIFYSVDDKPAQEPKEAWGLSENIRVLPKDDGRDPANGC